MNRSVSDIEIEAVVGSEVGQVAARPDPSRLELGGKLAGMSLPRQVVALAIWPLLEQLMNVLVGTVDLALAGRLDPQSIAVTATDALGVSGYVGWLMGMIHASVGIGSTALIARAVGASHKRLANAALGQSLLLAVGSGVIVGSVVYAAAPVIGWLANLDEQALAMCVQYLRIVALAAPASAILLVANACLRGSGDTRSPFVVMVAVNVINIAASVLFVYGPAPIGGHGVAGIAAGTLVAWIIGAILIMGVLIRGNGIVRLRLLRLRPHRHTLHRIMGVGVPSLVESVGGMWLGNFLVLMIVGSLAIPGAIGAHMIAIRVESLSFLPGFALGIAAATLVGQYLGLGDPHRARQATHLCWAMGVVLMGLLGVAFYLVPQAFVRLMTDAPPLMAMSPTLIRVCGPIQVFFATQLVLAAAMRGAGDTRMTMLMTAGSTFLVRLPAVYLLGVVFGYGLTGVWFALCGELVLRGVLFAWRFQHGGWAKVQV
ncbi:MAG: MATE family efflux transporter [Phycisphaeraceae bacterium]